MLDIKFGYKVIIEIIASRPEKTPVPHGRIGPRHRSCIVAAPAVAVRLARKRLDEEVDDQAAMPGIQKAGLFLEA